MALRPSAETDRPRVDERFIVDNSVWQRQGQPTVRSAMARLMEAHSPWSILTCPPVVAAAGFSARSGADHDAVCRFLAEFPECEAHPRVALVLGIQNALWGSGLLRSVGAVDTVIAGYAIANDATVVHYDADFDHVGRVRDDFRHSWIAPRGTLDA